MAKASRAYVCQACGAVTSRWSGKCGACGEWNSIIEETAPAGSPALVAIKGGKARLGARATFETLASAATDPPRLPTGIGELDRVLGGGLVPGSAVLVGGDPGIGKSTLLLQAAASLAGCGVPVRLSLRRRSDGTGSAARGPARARRCFRGARHGDQPRQYHSHLVERTAPRARRHQLGADAVVGGRRCRARHHLAAEKRGVGARQLRQDKRRGCRASRPCHQGRADRGAKRHRAHGRYRALFRGRSPAISSASCAR